MRPNSNPFFLISLLNFISLFRFVCPFALDHDILSHWIMSWVMLLLSVTRYLLSRCAYYDLFRFPLLPSPLPSPSAFDLSLLRLSL